MKACLLKNQRFGPFIDIENSENSDTPINWIFPILSMFYSKFGWESTAFPSSLTIWKGTKIDRETIRMYKETEKRLETNKLVTCHLNYQKRMHNVILADVTFHAAGYVLMIEDYLTDQPKKLFKTCVPISFGSKIFIPTHLKLSIYAKEFLTVLFGFDTLAISFWEVRN